MCDLRGLTESLLLRNIKIPIFNILWTSTIVWEIGTFSLIVAFHDCGELMYFIIDKINIILHLLFFQLLLYHISGNGSHCDDVINDGTNGTW